MAESQSFYSTQMIPNFPTSLKQMQSVRLRLSTAISGVGKLMQKGIKYPNPMITNPILYFCKGEFDRDIAAMPMGMHTVVSVGGSNFSGRQQQRLLIARALALVPLLFDNVTFSLS